MGDSSPHDETRSSLSSVAGLFFRLQIASLANFQLLSGEVYSGVFVCILVLNGHNLVTKNLLRFDPQDATLTALV